MNVVAQLTERLGPNRVRAHPLDLLIYAKDSGVSSGEAAVVARSECTGEVAEIMRIAAAAGMPMVASGAGTGLAGGAIGVPGSALIVHNRMTKILEIDEVGGTAWVGPGVINLELSNTLEKRGFQFAPDPASQQSATVGGNVGTNVDGPHCLAE